MRRSSTLGATRSVRRRLLPPHLSFPFLEKKLPSHPPPRLPVRWIDRVSSLQPEKKLPPRHRCLSTGFSCPILGWTVPFFPFNASLSSLSTPRVRPGSTRKVVWAVGLGQLHVWIERRTRARLDAPADRTRSQHGHRHAVRTAGHAQGRAQLLRRDQRSRPEEHRSLQRSGTDHQDLHGTSWCDKRRRAKRTNEEWKGSKRETRADRDDLRSFQDRTSCW